MPTTLSSLFPLQKVDIVRNQTVYDPQDRDTWPISGETVQGINTMGLSKEQYRETVSVCVGGGTL